MGKIRIKSYATTANLGVGFDFLGLALDIYNVTEFELSDDFCFINFDNVDNNLIYDSYLYVFKKFKMEAVKVTINQVIRNIPLSRGLGSSASAITTGVLAANYFGKFNLSDNELLKIMNEIEGHPDNIAPCFYGGLISTIINDGNILTFNNEINNNLNFYIFIPKYEVKTQVARSILPKSLSYSELTYNASRAFIAKDALKNGDIELLKIALSDTVHEKYRKDLIKEYDYFYNKYKNSNVILKISGSGSTLLFISDKELNDESLIKVNPSFNKMKVEEL